MNILGGLKSIPHPAARLYIPLMKVDPPPLVPPLVGKVYQKGPSFAIFRASPYFLDRNGWLKYSWEAAIPPSKILDLSAHVTGTSEYNIYTPGPYPDCMPWSIRKLWQMISNECHWSREEKLALIFFFDVLGVIWRFINHKYFMDWSTLFCLHLENERKRVTCKSRSAS